MRFFHIKKVMHVKVYTCVGFSLSESYVCDFFILKKSDARKSLHVRWVFPCSESYVCDFFISKKVMHVKVYIGANLGQAFSCCTHAQKTNNRGKRIAVCCCLDFARKILVERSKDFIGISYFYTACFSSRALQDYLVDPSTDFTEAVDT